MTSVASLHPSPSPSPLQVEAALSAASRGAVKLLYVAPEKLLTPWLLGALRRMTVSLVGWGQGAGGLRAVWCDQVHVVHGVTTLRPMLGCPALSSNCPSQWCSHAVNPRCSAAHPASAAPAQVAVDEAHCVSEWGHSFRPAYLRLGHVLRHVLGPRVVLGLTATATRPTAAEVAGVLGLAPGAVLREQPLRDNLRLRVRGGSRWSARVLCTVRPLPPAFTPWAYNQFLALRLEPLGGRRAAATEGVPASRKVVLFAEREAGLGSTV